MFAVLPVATLTPNPVQAVELMKWERIPLQVTLKVGQERVVFVDKNVRVGIAPALKGKLRVQSTGGAVYLKANEAFSQTRVQLQDVENGEIIMLDVTAGAKGSAEPVKLVYEGGDSEADASPEQADAAKEEKKVSYSAPLPVLLTRYASQRLYAPLRTVEPVPGVRSLPLHLSSRITTLYPAEPLEIQPIAAWAVQSQNVVAFRVRNMTSRKIVLDPRSLQGKFVSATFQHRFLGLVGTPEDTTMLYLVMDSRPENALIPEAKVSRKARGKHHAD
ncbi:TIGR03749 family integrating conjugative element protein [Erwiniaceae bacterium L1_55_4]|nr:TIGR03749 family integrating conjugative element protein [Erwiniaceae bacterium L1_55_4]